MARPKQWPRRSSTNPVPHQIRVAKQCVSFYTYGEMLLDALTHSLSRGAASVSPTNLALSLTCGRIVAAGTPGSVYERCLYCTVNKACRCCYYNHEHDRAEKMSNDIETLSEQRPKLRLHQIVFSMPKSKTFDESVEHSGLALLGMKSLVGAHENWNRRTSTLLPNRLYDYALGLHLKPQKDSSLMWPHVHMALVVGSKITARGDFGRGYLTYLQEAFQHAVNLERPTQVVLTNSGALGKKALGKSERVRQHKSTTVSHDQLVNTLAYVFRNTEDDDTHDDSAARARVLAALGNPSTFRRSRIPSSAFDSILDDVTGESASRPRTRQTRQFDPARLGKTSVYLFPFDGPPREIDAADFDSEQELLLVEAGEIVRHYLARLQAA